MKNVISYSLFGAKPIYLRGAMANAFLAKDVYPGWTCRFYVDDVVPLSVLESLRADGAEVILKGRNDNMSGMLWRFEPAFDPEVGYFVVRDVDDRLSYREKTAVDEWVASGKPFHVMRDHPNHKYPMMGGMWGGISGAVPEFKDILTQYAGSRDLGFWSDMGFLNECLWEKFVKNNHIAHDEFYRPLGTEKKFFAPLENINIFVGNKYDENENPVYDLIDGDNSNSGVFLCHNLGLGDHVVCNGLVRSRASGKNLYLFAKRRNVPSVLLMFRDMPNVHVIGVDTDEDVQRIIARYQARHKILLGVYGDNFRTIPDKSFDEVFYLQAGVTFSDRWDRFGVCRDLEEEERVFSLLAPSTPYAFVHDDSSRGFSIPVENLPSLPIVRPQPGLSTIFGYLKLIENAEEVHCIDSSFMLMIDSFEMSKTKLFFHKGSRYSDYFVTPRLRRAWKLS